MSGLEAIGDAVTGGVVGRAVEPKAGEDADGHTRETHCLNCGAPLAGPFCHECGQHAHVHRTLRSFFHDFLHGVLHFEGKIWRTLPLLAWRPGELTRRYIDGQRASFVSPIALFLFSVFLTFAVMGLTSNGSFGQLSTEASADLARDLKKDQQKIAQLEQRRADTIRKGGATAAIDAQLSDLRTEVTALQTVKTRRMPSTMLNLDMMRMPDWVGEGVEKAKRNPELLLYKIKTNAYKFSWALIPISVPFVWLLFPFSRRFRLYDHTVFVTYSLCFMMLLLITATLVGFASQSLASLGWFVPPVHMYRQLRGAYGVSAFGAVWRTVALTVFAFIAIGLFAGLLIGLGEFG
ncbi:MAG: DUF3667 domain-containing protein [Sphingomicrobium sp.]